MIVIYKNELYHHGIEGQKWGVRNGPPYPLNRNGTVFISGSWRTSESGSPYQRARLPRQVTDQIDEYIRDKKQIIVGEAPGVDRQVQDYLNSRNYSNVVVFGVDSGARYIANPNWRVRLISSNAPRGSSEWLAAKDVAMSNEATEGLTIVLDNGGAGATRNNAARLMRDGKPVSVFRLSSDGENLDSFVNERDEIVMHSDELYHHGIEGQKWGVRNGPPYPLNRDVKDSINRAKSSAKSYFTAKNEEDALEAELIKTKADQIRYSKKREQKIDEILRAMYNENNGAVNRRLEAQGDFFRELNDAEYRLRSGNAGKTSMKSILEDPEILDLYEQIRAGFAREGDSNDSYSRISGQMVWQIASSYNRELRYLNLDDIAEAIDTRAHERWATPLIEESYFSIKKRT